MITIPTVFVLGAGASVPYGFPTGKRLRDDICKHFKHELETLIEEVGSPTGVEVMGKEAGSFARIFYESSTTSIDLFLARNQEFSEIGKKAIVLNILKAEKNSRFREDAEGENQDWYSHLFENMTRELIKPESYNLFGKNEISFITFNYDRSLEHFLYKSLSNSFRSIPEEKITAELKKIPIFHVYGKVDKLPWEERPKTRHNLGYGGHYGLDIIQRMTGNIRLIHERSNENDRDMIQTISQARRVFFLGFGYATENLNILDIPKVLDGSQKIYGTARGKLEREIREIRSRLNKYFRTKDPGLTNPRIMEMDCVRLLREYL